MKPVSSVFILITYIRKGSFFFYFLSVSRFTQKLWLSFREIFKLSRPKYQENPLDSGADPDTYPAILLRGLPRIKPLLARVGTSFCLSDCLSVCLSIACDF